MGLADEPTIILSGPVSHRGQAVKQLAASGFTIAEGDPKHGHGLADTTDGQESKTVSFITVHGEDIDLAQEVASGFGYVLRAHHQGVKRESPLIDPSALPVNEDRVRELIEQALKARS